MSLSLIAVTIGVAAVSITLESIRFSDADWSRFSKLLSQAVLLAIVVGPASLLLDLVEGLALRTLVWSGALIVASGSPGLSDVVPFDRLFGARDFAHIWETSIILPLGLATIGAYLTVIASNWRSGRG